jgi:hypothetical protein
MSHIYIRNYQGIFGRYSVTKAFDNQPPLNSHQLSLS